MFFIRICTKLYYKTKADLLDFDKVQEHKNIINPSIYKYQTKEVGQFSVDWNN